MDCSLELPDVIIHKIMDYLPTKAVVRSCVLLSSPKLGEELSLHRVEIVLGDVQDIDVLDFEMLSELAPGWMKLALDVGVKVLAVYIGSNDFLPILYFPNCSSKALTCLKVAGFIFDQSFSSILGNFESLGELILCNCEIKDYPVLELPSCFPLLENLAIIYCFGFESVSVSASNIPSVKNLKVLAWGYETHSISIEIPAPTLEILCLRGKTISLPAFHNLTFLLLYDTEKKISCIVSELPVLENLTLIWFKCEVLKISSQQLQNLILSDPD
ncbi:hypothetical protein SLEP1_g42602 [Rubroshorea leprosula]|uniref:F-box/LRR-repeat protein 15/At3g58940/PEG3-like LRR domain-containing protein n=1 Tax=Rubroshorea leprosula TaxID=152421 RepID=A0AAV5LAH0_9ROSI|nr:hypothetical protein SLEP1_g42602 [Rubroshorea leprosula]